MVNRWTQLAHAKVNVALYVGKVRPDGYHPVATVIQRLELHDRVEFAVLPRSTGGLEVSVTADWPHVPSGEQNLAWKAVMLLRAELEKAGYANAKIEIRLEKHIPVAAGLAGGSADAAAVLGGLNRRLGLGIEHEALMERAAELGSDVPACLIKGTVLCTGRGERVRPIASPRLWWVLANPGGELSVGDVYHEFDALKRGEETGGRDPRQLEAAITPLVNALAEGEVAHVADCLHNDLQEAASRLHEGVAPLLTQMRKLGALSAMVSGSGPTVAGLASDAATAERIAEALAQSGAWAWWGPGLAS